MDDPLKQAYNGWENDGSLLLLTWDLVESALAYADRNILFRHLADERVTDDNPFTYSLYRSIMNDDRLHQPVDVLTNEASNAYTCADVIKD